MDEFPDAGSGKNAASAISGRSRQHRGKPAESLTIEKRRLEDMVAELFKKGKHNLGADKKILAQSGKLDKLVVDEMMLAEMEEKHLGKKQEK